MSQLMNPKTTKKSKKKNNMIDQQKESRSNKKYLAIKKNSLRTLT